MFATELKAAVEHFDYENAILIWNKVNQADHNQRYQVTDVEDALYWELDAKMVDYEKNVTEDKPKVKGSGIWVEIWE